MLILQSSLSKDWTLIHKIIFRFFFVFIFIFIAPWSWLDAVPYYGELTVWYDNLMDWAVRFANEKIFNIKEVLVPVSGSGDTSWGWAQLWMIAGLALVVCFVWTLIDRKRKSYNKLNYWLCLFTRYYIAMIAFLYGIIKLFALQMTFPNISQLATPLGDFLPMRLSWMFMGYSTPYQVFSGAMEVLAGLLLLSRRTATLGTMMAAGVFINVMAMNLSYDIPVKIFSMRLVLMCFFLLANEYKRIISFFILNKPADACSIYQVSFSKKWMRVTRIVFKLIFIGFAVGWMFYNTLDRYKQQRTVVSSGPIKTGVYDVVSFVLNKDTLLPLITDTLRWHDIIFENGFGSVKSSDNAFRRRYNRGYFNFVTDTAKQTVGFKKLASDSTFSFFFYYNMPDSNSIILKGITRKDSLFVFLIRSNRHFQLAEKQFHWLSEANR
jgi:hypothetical protein